MKWAVEHVSYDTESQQQMQSSVVFLETTQK